MGSINLDTVKTMLESSNCTFPDLAKTFDVSLDEIVSFFSLHKLEPPSAKNLTSGDSIGKLLTGSIPDRTISGDRNKLLLDYVNNLPQGLAPQELDPSALLCRFHKIDPEKGLQCAYCGRYEVDIQADPANDLLSIFVDNNPSNFLITNITPCCKLCLVERFDRMPFAREKITYTLDLTHEDIPEELHRITSMSLVLFARIDALLGSIFNKHYLDTLFDQWIVYPLKTGKAFFNGIPYTPALLSLWAFKQLTEFGLLKGLTEVTTSAKEPDVLTVESTVTFESLLVFYSMYYQSMGIKQESGRVIAPGTPENLDRAKNLSKLVR